MWHPSKAIPMEKVGDLIRFQAKCSMLKETLSCNVGPAHFSFDLMSTLSWEISWWKMGISWECERSSFGHPQWCVCGPVANPDPQNQVWDSSSGRNIEFSHLWDSKSIFGKRWESEISNPLVFYDLGSDKRSRLCCVRMLKCIFNTPHKWVGFCRCWISGWKRGKKINWGFFWTLGCDGPSKS